ncbi:MAG TPA: BON domain-containing protein [Bryobacteraceae bacterium]|nr:BON domain-containing protein [Bryobacteraceae bacterium]
MICRFASRVCLFSLFGFVLTATFPAAPLQEPDNTSVNKADRGNTPNADKAKNDTSDRELMRHIRHDVITDKSLSTYGHNVKIIAVNGKVTLRGVVRSDDEKKAIEEHAAKYAGAGNVTNELTVKGS